MSGYVLQWHGEQSEVVFMPTRGTRQGCKFGLVLYRIAVEEVFETLVASWKWAPKPCSLGHSIGQEHIVPDLNHVNAIHLLLFADDIYVLTTTWRKALKQLEAVQERLRMIEMVIAKHKTEMACMSGPIVVPPLGAWGGMHVGGPETTMVVFGAGFTINHTFATAWETTPLRAMK
eukprot:3027406-Amphidinium_carterae.2